MSEPYVPEPAPEPDAHHDPMPARCPHCGRLLLRASLDQYRCTEHGIVRPWYGRNEDFLAHERRVLEGTHGP